MLNNGNGQMSYNDFIGIEEIPYRVIEYLITNKSDTAEDMWKALYYPDADCLKKPNLTTKQKRNLVYDGKSSQEQDFKLFTKPLISDSLITADDMIQLRMFRYSTSPVERLFATILFEIDIYTSDKTSVITKYVNKKPIPIERTDFIETRLLNLLVGKDLGIGYNFMQFDRSLSTYSKSVTNINNSKAFYGRTFMLCLQYSSIDKGQGC